VLPSLCRKIWGLRGSDEVERCLISTREYLTNGTDPALLLMKATEVVLHREREAQQHSEKNMGSLQARELIFFYDSPFCDLIQDIDWA